MKQVRRKRLLRLTVHQNGEDVVAVVGLEEIPDLCLAPLGLGKPGRADHDQEFRVVERIVNAVRQ